MNMMNFSMNWDYIRRLVHRPTFEDRGEIVRFMPFSDWTMAATASRL